ALRLYPPAWLLERQAIRDDEIGGYYIPARSVVAISPYVMHRHPVYWDNPEGFDPERFSPEQSRDRPRYAYLPFGAGLRQRIGNAFALTEAQAIVASIAQRYQLHLAPGHPVQLDPLVTLRARQGMLMTVHPQHAPRAGREPQRAIPATHSPGPPPDPPAD